jgi:hypothetical protein
MNDARPRFAADATQVRDVVQQRVDERAGGMAGARMHHHPGGFIQHDKVRVLVQDFQRERFRRHRRRFDGRDGDADAITFADGKVRLGLAPIEADVPVGDEFLDLGSGMAVENRCQKPIQPLPVEVGRNGELERHL